MFGAVSKHGKHGLWYVMIYHIVAIPAAWLLPHHWMVIFFVISTTKKMKSVGKDIKPTKIVIDDFSFGGIATSIILYKWSWSTAMRKKNPDPSGPQLGTIWNCSFPGCFWCLLWEEGGQLIRTFFQPTNPFSHLRYRYLQKYTTVFESFWIIMPAICPS